MDSHTILRRYENKSSRYWEKLQQTHALTIFKLATKHVAAYKKFLRSNSVAENSVKKYDDFVKLPFINKKNYFHIFDHEELVKNKFYKTESLVMTSTSGSTGMPTYFPRTEKIDWQYSVLAEFFLSNGPKGSTLVIDCFGMGVWIGGLITYQAFRIAGLRGLPVTIITPGINKKEIFHSLKTLAPHFDNVILAGYPPFVKDILDEGRQEGIDFTKFHMRLLFAAESFTENFRDYVCKAAGIKNCYADTLNIYGSAELGAMAFETPGSIFIRRLAIKNTKLFKKIFPLGTIPTLAQYNPEFVSFEEKDNHIFITADGPVPFVRYQIGDVGGTYTFDKLKKLFELEGINIIQEAKKIHLSLLQLPFVFIHIRSDFSTKLYGAIIHPQPIQEALQSNELKSHVTGKFALMTKSDKNHNQYLEVNIELRNNLKPNSSLIKKAKEAITKFLLRKNAEYKNNFSSMPKKVTPVVKLWPHESSQYFKPGIKQAWIVK